MLMNGIAAQDPASLELLYDRYGNAIFSFCLRALRDRMLAEEVLMDVFWEIWERGERYDHRRGTPYAYLFGVTRSRVLDRLRAVRAVKRRGLINGSVAVGEQADPKLIRHGQLGALIVHERRKCVLAALKQLQPVQRTAIELAFFDGLTHREIANHLKQPLGTVKFRIRRGLARLRRLLNGHDVGNV